MTALPREGPPGWSTGPGSSTEPSPCCRKESRSRETPGSLAALPSSSWDSTLQDNQRCCFHRLAVQAARSDNRPVGRTVQRQRRTLTLAVAGGNWATFHEHIFHSDAPGDCESPHFSGISGVTLVKYRAFICTQTSPLSDSGLSALRLQSLQLSTTRVDKALGQQSGY